MAWFVKIEEGLVDKNTFDRYVPAHKAYVEKLIAQGHQASTGYWGQRGGGMMLFQAHSMEEARTIVEQDPLVINACVTYHLYEWKVVLSGVLDVPLENTICTSAKAAAVNSANLMTAN
jgi:uncharacterized protein YciI